MKLQVQRENAVIRMKFKPFFKLVQRVFSKDPGASRKTLTSRVKKSAKEEEACEHLIHAKSLSVQGELFNIVDNEVALVWAKAIQSLPPFKLKFALNVAQDTLPTQCEFGTVEERK